MFPWNNQFPFNQSNFTKQFQKMNPKEVEQYIEDIMKNIFGSEPSNKFPFHNEVDNERTKTQELSEFDIYETTDYLYVKIGIPKEKIESIKVQHSSHQLFIHSDTDENEKTTYMLPSPVAKKGTKAHYENGILEIQLTKLHEHTISEISILKE
ncbi:Hsp20/alpha crystallin family protein [Metabacillus malikii]|uniref:HSP20 family molecular chaperone IbpA n=1 Tax=Metabacillus malikii TaxID=1504265 RepID=A0ABT9Z9H5_9BACI|nr:Hsp20/alpha crystallin family protein [Metabacillus malikii]MDQ0228908.1 HSP20 family molecular chaperone IbpA [Metabacillus malikii]